jgi:hypothetical protein
MTLTELVPSLEVCQQLKAAGFQQDTALVWAKLFQEPWLPPEVEQVMERLGRQEVHTDYILCAAPTAEEILRELPQTLRGWSQDCFLDIVYRNDYKKWYVGWQTDEDCVPSLVGDTLIEAAALAYLWWKEQK